MFSCAAGYKRYLPLANRPRPHAKCLIAYLTRWTPEGNLLSLLVGSGTRVIQVRDFLLIHPRLLHHPSLVVSLSLRGSTLSKHRGYEACPLLSRRYLDSQNSNRGHVNERVHYRENCLNQVGWFARTDMYQYYTWYCTSDIRRDILNLFNRLQN